MGGTLSLDCQLGACCTEAILKFLIITLAGILVSSCSTLGGALGKNEAERAYADEAGNCYYVNKNGGRVYDNRAQCWVAGRPIRPSI